MHDPSQDHYSIFVYFLFIASHATIGCSKVLLVQLMSEEFSSPCKGEDKSEKLYHVQNDTRPMRDYSMMVLTFVMHILGKKVQN